MTPAPWIVSDELWALVEPLLPRKERRFRSPGRKRLSDREALCAILFVLHTGGVPADAESPNVVHGMRGSPGVATGPARVLRSLGEAERLQAGDVLVTETTAPPWTPLFARAAAIVTDAGGILSHCAVVAREYSIPAVVGTRMGTSVIKDGQLVEVDGTNGTVRIVE